MRGARELVCHRHTSLVSYEDHHVWPQEYHGPSIPSNMVRICCNAHSDVHFLLHLLLTNKAHRDSDYGMTVRQIAYRGYQAIMAYSESLATLAEHNTVTTEKP